MVSREAVLDGQIGALADPGNPEEIRAAIKEALIRPHQSRKELEYFSFERFVERWHAMLKQSLAKSEFARRYVVSAPQ